MKATDRRFTLEPEVVEARRLACVTKFDLDVAAEQASHHARDWYGPDHTVASMRNGLDGRWWGTVFCNPPWSKIEPWIQKGLIELFVSRVECVTYLLPATTDVRWWQQYVEPQREGRSTSVSMQVRFLPGRPRFGTPDDPTGDLAGSPPFRTVIIVLRRGNV